MNRYHDITRTIMRSDGSAKVYGHNTSGELLTVVLRRNVDGKWTIAEIATRARITHVFPAN